MKITIKKQLTVFTLGAMLILGGCGAGQSNSATKTDKAAEKVTIHYSAAASLKDALSEIATDYEKTHKDETIDIDFAGSGQIRQKVVSGAPIDGVLLASKSDADQLKDKDKITNAKEVLKNDLVVVANKQDNIKKEKTLAAQLKQAKKIAIGEPKTVPAGAYAEETFASLKLENELKPNLVLANDVRQVLAYTESGNVDLGLVYRTDALISDKVSVVYTVPEKLHAPITYWTGDVKETKHAKEVEAFNKYLGTKDAEKVFDKYGFQVAN
ncbi:Molybdate-binding periplasmic protein precursor [Listeria grayi]|uniref:molybdate ABC transporter substrate-binding protein n=1 Tax=Listeria grayi TaxID=1641 RepID=UPI000F6FD9E4|nr:molybdate ABC transporter substrate-binding protein [Listeria grayi]VEI30786.1 Molybdate-binding periplasmic protein precursor [Listeria grayi]